MNIKCPNCGAVHSLDTLINDAEASAVLKAVLEMDAELGKAAIRYIGLFRPAKSQLSWARTAKLLNELLPMIKAIVKGHAAGKKVQLHHAMNGAEGVKQIGERK